MRHTPEVEDIALPPGRYFLGGGNCRMRTMLGSGVVITLWHRARRIGAIAHFLPGLSGSGIPLELDGHMGPEGLQLVLQALQWSQIDPADCVARICGSGNVISRTDSVPSLNTGQAGGEFARRLLRARGLPIVSERFYAADRHQIVFDVGTGRVQARRVKPVTVAIDAQPKSRIGPISPARQNVFLRNTHAR
jgi:chemotaxis protein CheD